MYDLLIKNVRVVRPGADDTPVADIAVQDGRIARVGPDLDGEAHEEHDGAGRLAFPGAIDAHTHVGIYVPPDQDAPTESASAVSGGCTTMLTYVRTGSLYLDRPGPVREFWPELLAASEGNYHCDYGYHVSPIQGAQVAETEWIATEAGCPNFGEVFMFYGSHGLHGGTDKQREWLMLDEGDHYDLAHFDAICREAAAIQGRHPEIADLVQVSWHCEVPELLRAYETKVQSEGRLSGLEAYSAARPPHAEALAVQIAGTLAHHAGLSNINVLHITSRAALQAAKNLRQIYPGLDVGMEVTAGHLLLDYTSPCGVWGKVNPPLRAPEDREALWDAVADGTLQWAMTDHANAPADQKVDADDPGNVWKAHAGFGGVEYLLPGLFSEGTRRGLPPGRIAELTAGAPARRFGLLGKGDVAEGYDADLALLDPDETWTIRAQDSLSTQGYTPFEGIEVTGRVKATYLRGRRVFEDGAGVTGDRAGQYLPRPYRAG